MPPIKIPTSKSGGSSRTAHIFGFAKNTFPLRHASLRSFLRCSPRISKLVLVYASRSPVQAPARVLAPPYPLRVFNSPRELPEFKNHPCGWLQNSGDPCGIRTRDLQDENLMSWTTRRRGLVSLKGKYTGLTQDNAFSGVNLDERKLLYFWKSSLSYAKRKIKVCSQSDLTQVSGILGKSSKA